MSHQYPKEAKAERKIGLIVYSNKVFFLSFYITIVFYHHNYHIYIIVTIIKRAKEKDPTMMILKIENS
jgi:hypothetical protein